MPTSSTHVQSEINSGRYQVSQTANPKNSSSKLYEPPIRDSTNERFSKSGVYQNTNGSAAVGLA